jgi:uncharacterized protein YqeY
MCLQMRQDEAASEAPFNHQQLKIVQQIMDNNLVAVAVLAVVDVAVARQAIHGDGSVGKVSWMSRAGSPSVLTLIGISLAIG